MKESEKGWLNNWEDKKDSDEQKKTKELPKDSKLNLNPVEEDQGNLFDHHPLP